MAFSLFSIQFDSYLSDHMEHNLVQRLRFES